MLKKLDIVSIEPFFRSHQTKRVTGALDGTLRRNRSFSRHVFLVHRCTNLYRFCTRRPCWLIPTRQLKSLLVAVLPFWESVNGLTFWHGRYCPCSFAATRWPDGCRKLRHRRYQKMYKVSCSSACRWRLSGKSICNVRARPLLWPLTRLMHLVLA